MAKTKSKRKAISTKLRFEIFKRDDFTCQYCGDHPPKVVLHIDHIIPVVEGGGNDEENLVTSCDKCNLGKGPRMLSAKPKTLGQSAAEVAEREEQIRGYAEVMQAKRERIDREAWEALEPWLANFCYDEESRGIRHDWLSSVKRFVQQLCYLEVLEAMELAVQRQPHSQQQCFKYFCGICWRKIKQDFE